jgi:peptide/nickel transport system substrate-binding protein
MKAFLSCGLVVFLVFSASVSAEEPGKVLRVVPHSNLAIIDPFLTTAVIVQEHGYMIYDVLFAPDAHGAIKPQMVDRHEVSKDGKTWTFRLRDGLEFHDGQPVTSADVIASLQRWGQRDTMGQRLLSLTDSMEVVDAKSFRIKLKTPYGWMLETLGKGSNAPFIMPKRVAETPSDKQLDDTTGSGPFIFKRDEWKPGEKVVYLKNPKYRPRAEPADGLAGGKVVKVDRVEWIIIKDPQTQINALVAGEVDVVEAPAYESYEALKANADIEVKKNRRGLSIVRFNHLQPPFNNPKIRQAAMAAMEQTLLQRAQVGVPELYDTCFSVYPCGSQDATTKGMDFVGKGDAKRARELLKEAGYDGTSVVVMQPTDQTTLGKFPLMAAQLLRQAGFKVDVQAMDWQTLVSRRAKKDPPAKGGWNLFITDFSKIDLGNPLSHLLVGAACEKAWFGWPCDAEVERLRDAFASCSDPTACKAIAEQVQVRAMEVGTYAPIGEHWLPRASRRNVKGLIEGFYMVLWNAERT